MIANDSVVDQTGSSSASCSVSVSMSNGSASVVAPSIKPIFPAHSGNGHAVIEIPVEVLLVASVDDDDDDDDDDDNEHDVTADAVSCPVARGGSRFRMHSAASSSATERRHRRTRQQRSVPNTLISGPTLPSASVTPAMHEQLLSPLSELEESTSGSTSSGESTTGSSSDDDDDDECWVEAEMNDACAGVTPSAFEWRGTSDSMDPSRGNKLTGNDPGNDGLCTGDDEINNAKLRQTGNGIMSSDDVDQFFDVEPSSFPDERDSSALRSTFLGNSHMMSLEAISNYDYSTAETAASAAAQTSYSADSVDSAVSASAGVSGTGGVVRTAKSSSRDPLNSTQGTAGLTTRLGHLFNSAVMKAHRQLGRG